MMLIWRLLRQHISVVQLVGFFLANLVGVAIILCGIQLYNDLSTTLAKGGSLTASDYIVISKRVSSQSMFDRSANRFSSEEIEELARQPFVERVGEFRSSSFKVRAIVRMLNAQTLMFFESVPEEFVDVKSERWHYAEGDKVVPIIIPRAYLNLYNFGFSQSIMGLPQLSEELLREMQIEVAITTREGSVVSYEGYVVGFSDRINTILVPDAFLRWANVQYGHSKLGGSQGPSRLIFEVDNPADSAIGEYLQQRGYYPEDNASASSKMSYLLKVALAVVVAIGAIFSLLSLSILTLSIYLLLQKNSSKLENLVLVGYTPREVAAPYKMLTLALNLIVMVVAVVVALVVRSCYMDALSAAFGAELSGSTLAMLLAAVAITVAVVLFNAAIIQRKVDEISRKRV